MGELVKTMKFTVITSCYNQLELLKKSLPYWQKQTFKDFEWIIADDGSANFEEIKAWSETVSPSLPITIVTHPDEGFRLAKILNDAAREARGEHLVWVMADSYPKEDFLEQLNKVVQADRVTNGLRIQVDPSGYVVGSDWRLGVIAFPVEGQDGIKLYHPRPWELMSSNSMSMPKAMFDSIDGWYEGFKGYGQEDWDLVMRAYYSGAELWWAPNANIYHLQHPDRADTPDNVTLFRQRLATIQESRQRHA